MTNKIGPYGSHNGVGCYTKNCSYRDAADAGVKAPLTYEQANAALTDATYAGHGAEGWRKNNEARELARKNAGDARDATPEGIRILKKTLADNREKNGRHSALAIGSELRLNKARRNFFKNDQQYRNAVFNAAKSLEPIDLKRLAYNTENYHYDKAQKALVDTRTGKAVASISNGNLSVTSADGVTSVTSSSDENHTNNKEQLVKLVNADVNKRISRYPTASQTLDDAVSGYDTDVDIKADNSSTAVVKDRKSTNPYMVVKYDTTGKFKEAVVANTDGSITSLGTDRVIAVISVLRSREIKKRPALSDWMYTNR